MASYSNVRDYFQGRLGSLVYSSNRGTKYVKVFVPPSNPNTEAQQKVRSVWSDLGHIAHAIYEPILKPYTFPKPTKMNAYNEFLKINADMFRGSTWRPEHLKIFGGSLPRPRHVEVDYVPIGKAVEISWDGIIYPERVTDSAVIILIQDREVVGTIIGERRDGSVVIELVDQTNAHQGAMDVYLAFSRAPAADTNEAGITSFTAYAPLVIPAFRKWELDEAQSPPQDAPAAPEGEPRL